MSRHVRAALVVGVSLAAAPFAAAFPFYAVEWQNRYPTSTLDERMSSTFGAVCYVCHVPEDFGEEGTCYRLAIRERLNQGDTIQQALAFVEPLDSDGDGVSNLDEILASRADLPGQVGYHPGRVGPTGLPTCPPGNTFIGTGVPETPPPSECAGDTNGDNQINSADLSVLLGQFGTAVPPGTGADFNDDGLVNAADLSVLLARFGLSC
jgi:hypothetical protein